MASIIPLNLLLLKNSLNNKNVKKTYTSEAKNMLQRNNIGIPNLNISISELTLLLGAFDLMDTLTTPTKTIYFPKSPFDLLNTDTQILPITHFYSDISKERTYELFNLLLRTANDKNHNRTFEDDLASIRQFLLDNTAVKAQLKKLDAILRKRLKPSPHIMQSLVNNTQIQPYKQFKLLSAYLCEWAQENGFGNPATLSTLQSDKEFLRLLAQKRLFKDTIFGHTSHGEWTHFIQWWCVTEANKENRFLTNNPADILHWLGHQKNSKWFTTFEFNMNSNPIHLSSSPIGHSVFTFTEFLVSFEGKQLAPLLSNLILSRIKRRIEKIQQQANSR